MATVMTLAFGQTEAGTAHAIDASTADSALLFEQADALEADGRWEEAAELLETLVESHPDDYALFLRLGMLERRAGHSSQAAEDYRRAVEISGGSLESRLGLAWSTLESGQSEQAALFFRGILAEFPDSELAREGLARAEGSPGTAPFEAAGGFSWISHSNHPYRESGWGFAGGVDGIVAERFPLGVTVRFMQFEQEPPDPLDSDSSGPGQESGSSAGSGSSAQRRASGSNWSQQEVYVRGGVSRLAYGLLGHLSWIRDEGEFDDDLFAVGLSMRAGAVSPLFVEASATFYPDGEVYRVSPAWRIPLRRGLYVQPGFALQVTADDDLEGNGFLELIGEGSKAGFKLGGKVGRESRPTYLSIPIVMNLIDEITWGIWTEASLRLGANGRLGVGYALSQLRVEQEQGTASSEMHIVSVNLGWTF